MGKIKELTPVYCEQIPDKLKEGILYVSDKFNTAIHLCCGCGQQSVTPFNKPNEWKLLKSENSEFVTLTPSIWNRGLACMSHYRIVYNLIDWYNQQEN